MRSRAIEMGADYGHECGLKVETEEPGRRRSADYSATHVQCHGPVVTEIEAAGSLPSANCQDTELHGHLQGRQSAVLVVGIPLDLESLMTCLQRSH